MLKIFKFDYFPAFIMVLLASCTTNTKTPQLSGNTVFDIPVTEIQLIGVGWDTGHPTLAKLEQRLEIRNPRDIEKLISFFYPPSSEFFVLGMPPKWSIAILLEDNSVIQIGVGGAWVAEKEEMSGAIKPGFNEYLDELVLQNSNQK